MKTECGVLGVWTPKLEMVNLVKPLLLKLQHRGQDSSGIGYIENESGEIKVQKALGKVENLIESNVAHESQYFIGHTRYTTSSKEKSLIDSAHPIIGTYNGENFTFVFNGNIPNVENDTEYIRDFFRDTKKTNFCDTLRDFIKRVPRAYNIIFIYDSKLWIIRDSYGTRPLNIMIALDGTVIISSETCVFDTLPDKQMNFTIDIKPGHITKVENGYIQNIEVVKLPHTAFCLFEYIYFMKPGSNSQEPKKSVGDIRRLFGKQLAIQELENPGDFNPKNSNDTIVTSIPNTANDYAIGYAKEMGLEFVPAVKKQESSLRTFIEPTQKERAAASRKKYIYDESLIKNKHVILVDDSIVRGITIKNIGEKIREYGPKSIHIRVGCPAIMNTCNLGVDMSSEAELIANQHLDTESIRDTLGVDSLIYLKLENINEVINLSNFCSGCMNGNYNGCNSRDLEW